MKRYIIRILMMSVVLSSCTKMMDAPMDDRVNLDDVFNSRTRIANYMNYPYWYMAQYNAKSGMIYDGHGFIATYCDEAQDSKDRQSGSKSGSWYEGMSTSKSFCFESSQLRWFTLFQAVRRCNTVIGYLADPNYYIPSSEFSDGYRKYYLAQCYIMRAYNYLELIKRFGPVPIIESRYEISHDFSNDKRASYAQCVDFIIADCDRALSIGFEANPTLVWKFGSGNAKREMTAAVAWMVKSEATTFAASPLWKDNYAGTKPYTWERALEISTDALDNMLMAGFSLVNFRGSSVSATANNIASYFLSNPDSDNETIYSAYEDSSPQRSIMWQYCGIPEDGVGQVYAGACPTQEMVDAYEVVNSTMSESSPLLDLSHPYNGSDHTTPNITSKAVELGYSETTPYANRDPRFYATIYYNGSKMGSVNVETYVGGKHQIDDASVSIRNTRTGYYLRKYRDPRSDRSNNYDGFARNYRLAHLYLNYVEALYNVCGATGQYSGTVKPIMAPKTALDALNAVRTRVGMPAIKSSEVASTEAFELRYRNERRIELAFEGHRFFDVRRWQQPAGNLSSTDRYVSAMKITKSTDGSFDYQRMALPERLCFENKYLIFPIPYDEVLKIQKQTGENWQNNNW